MQLDVGFPWKVKVLSTREQLKYSQKQGTSSRVPKKRMQYEILPSLIALLLILQEFTCDSQEIKKFFVFNFAFQCNTKFSYQNRKRDINFALCVLYQMDIKNKIYV